MSAPPAHDSAEVVATFTDHNRSGDGIGGKCKGDNSYPDNCSGNQQVFVVVRQLALIVVVSHEEKLCGNQGCRLLVLASAR